MPTPAASPMPELPPLPDGPSLDNVRGPIDVPLFETWQIVTVSIIAAILGIFLFWHFVQFVRHNSQQSKPLTPKAAALAELETAAKLTDDDSRFAVLITSALKLYFETGLKIPSRGRTSEEFARSLKGNTQLDASFKSTLENVFVHCDAMKFARQASTDAQRAELIETAKELINKAEQTKEDV
ncbi:MAG: hypothetical protein ACSHYA_04275 [Opitutaceae bacterium]